MHFIFQEFKKESLGVWLRGSNNWNLKEICPIVSEKIATRTTDDRWRTYFDFLSSADSQTELKIWNISVGYLKNALNN